MQKRRVRVGKKKPSSSKSGMRSGFFFVSIFPSPSTHQKHPERRQEDAAEDLDDQVGVDVDHFSVRGREGERKGEEVEGDEGRESLKKMEKKRSEEKRQLRFAVVVVVVESLLTSSSSLFLSFSLANSLFSLAG